MSCECNRPRTNPCDGVTKRCGLAVESDPYHSATFGARKNTIVFDDATDKVYVYGDDGAWRMFSYNMKESTKFGDKIFDGVQDSNIIKLSAVAIADTYTVYLNGLKQIEGRDFETSVVDSGASDGVKVTSIRFLFYSLQDDDTVEVTYRYVPTAV